jgi:hypothetical protein
MALETQFFIFDKKVGIDRFTPMIKKDLTALWKAKNVMYWAGRRSRGGSVKLNSSAMNDGGGVDVVKKMFRFDRQGVIYTLAYGGTKIYDVNLGTGALTSKTGSITLADTALLSGVGFNSANAGTPSSDLIITDGTNPLAKWNTSGNFTAIADTSAQGVQFLEAHEDRVFGCGKSSDPHRVFFCASYDATDWTTAGNAGSVLVYPEVGGKVIGLKSYGQYLYMFKTKGIFMIDTTSYNLNNWKVYRIADGIGGLSNRTIHIAGKDMVFASRRGITTIDRLTGYRVAAFTDPVLSDWKDISKTNANAWDAIIDEARGWYILAYNNTDMLVLDLENEAVLGEWDGISCASLLATEDSSGNDVYLAGGTDGFIRKFNDLSLYNDDSSVIYSEFHTPYVPVSMKNNRLQEFTLVEGGIFYKPVTTSCDLLVSIGIDGRTTATENVALSSSGDVLNTSFILNQSQLGGGTLNFSKFSLEGQGKYLQLKFKNQTLGEAFNMYGFYITYLPSGDV